MIRVELRGNIDPKYLSGRTTKLEQALTWEVMKDTRPFVPAKTMSLANRTYVTSGYIVYPGPYARYLFYGKRMVNAKTGKGPRYIPEVGYRWPKGAILKPTNEDLKISTAVHKDATSNWIEASKRKNMAKWERLAARIYTDGK